jgi:uncharacterized Tic20 family protein
MWKIVKAIVLRWLLARTFGKALGLLAALVPLGAILKALGVPLVIALLVLGLPVFLLLALLGVPFPLAALAAVGLAAFVGVLLALGWTLLKIAIPIVLIVWFIRWALSQSNGREHRKPGEAGPDMV